MGCLGIKEYNFFMLSKSCQNNKPIAMRFLVTFDC